MKKKNIVLITITTAALILFITNQNEASIKNLSDIFDKNIPREDKDFLDIIEDPFIVEAPPSFKGEFPKVYVEQKDYGFSIGQGSDIEVNK